MRLDWFNYIKYFLSISKVRDLEFNRFTDEEAFGMEASVAFVIESRSFSLGIVLSYYFSDRDLYPVVHSSNSFF